MAEYVLFTSTVPTERPGDNYTKVSGDDAEITLVPIPDHPDVPHRGRTRVHIWLPELPKHEISLWLDEIRDTK